jgi:hypothetical protein
MTQDFEPRLRRGIPGWGALDSFFLGAFGATIIASAGLFFGSGSSAMGRRDANITWKLCRSQGELQTARKPRRRGVLADRPRRQLIL